MERTPAYIATIEFNENDTEETKLRFCQIIRETFRNPKGLRVRGRLGKDSKYADLYRPGGRYYMRSSQDIRPEHAARVDIYYKSYYKE